VLERMVKKKETDRGAAKLASYSVEGEIKWRPRYSRWSTLAAENMKEGEKKPQRTGKKADDHYPEHTTYKLSKRRATTRSVELRQRKKGAVTIDQEKEENNERHKQWLARVFIPSDVIGGAQREHHIKKSRSKTTARVVHK